MGVVSNAGGKGSGKRPLSVSTEEFGEKFDAIFGKKKKSSQVDDNRISPGEHPLSKLLAAVPEDLYLNNTWVRSVCEEANKALIEIDKLKNR